MGLERILKWTLIVAGVLTFIGLVVSAIPSGEERPEAERSTGRPQPTEAASRTAPAPEQEPAREPPATPRRPPPPPPELPDYVTVRVNPRYDDISLSAVERAVAEVVHWYRSEVGLVAEVPSIISFEPECKPNSYTETLGYATPGLLPNGEQAILVCVRLDEDRDAVLLDEEFRWLLAHEYFHVLQANAAWEYEDYELSFGANGQCGLHMVEGSAEFFGQMYAWGELKEPGLLDMLDTLLSLDFQRWYYYEDGAQAFAALVRLYGREAATFWESDEERCADEFLSRFDVTPARWEESWREISQR